MKQPDTITIEVDEADEVFADSADLFVTIKGKSLVTGREAFKKAGEVRELVEGLTAYGVAEADILLQSVQADVSSGIIGKQSSATYRLRIKCRQLDQLADILGIITKQQNTDLNRIYWRYEEIEAVRAELLEKCLSRAKLKAEKVAASLKVELLGVHSFEEYISDVELEAAHAPPTPVAAAARKGAFGPPTVTKEQLGLSVSHSKRAIVQVTVKYRVSKLRSKKGKLQVEEN
jgi:uncharacterized protein YggE